jgi:hypothetical protein
LKTKKQRDLLVFSLMESHAWDVSPLPSDAGIAFFEAGEQALVEVLEGVHSLLELTLGGRQTSLQNYVHFVLWLKNIGGKRAIYSCSRTEWIDWTLDLGISLFGVEGMNRG